MTYFSWLLLAACLVATPAPPRPTQAQVARRFLLDALHANYPAAYRRLAPEVRAGLPLPAFRAAARRLGQARGTAIELYQIGAYLGEPPNHTEWFCRFRFAADSVQRSPRPLLEVTFRDTASRQVLGFKLRE
ncbi:MAG: hypothetical protein ACRYFX_21705 [Janthinobacterium lividum]